MYRVRVFEQIIFEGEDWKIGTMHPPRVDYTCGSDASVSIDGNIYDIPTGDTVYVYQHVVHLPSRARASDDD